MKYWPSLYSFLLLSAVTAAGADDEDYAATVQKHCPCPGVYPLVVCGTDGITYNSTCQLTCVKWLHKPTLQTASIGPCPAPGHCRCANEPIAPVCGIDGSRARTFDNECQLLCNKDTRAPNLKLLHKGPCSEIEMTKCVCPSVQDFVCGSDGVTYPSLCDLNCKSKAGTFVAHAGECKKN